ncbi:MAG: beta-ketoacyl synthase N-terminal-like domain-containing protein [Desulfosarcinaceae bacterium]
MSDAAVITGVGVVSPLGLGKTAFGDALFSGCSAIAPIEAFDTRTRRAHLGAEIPAVDYKAFLSLKGIRRMDRLSKLAATAARLATEDAGVDLSAGRADRHGIIMGTSFGATDIAVRFASVIFTESARLANPRLVPNTVMNAPAGHIAIEFDLRGVNTTVNHREISAEMAVACAAAQIQAGKADLLLAGGADILTDFFFEVLGQYRTLSPQDEGPEGARPFDARRNGCVAGEAAGMLCLESRSHAEARGATIYGKVAGWGQASAPAPPTGWPVDAKGPRLAMERALAAAGCRPKEIDLIYASANGGRVLDRLEEDAIEGVFGRGKNGPRVTAIKGALGESFAGGALRTVAAALSQTSGRIPPTLGLRTPERPLNHVLAPLRLRPPGRVLVNAMAPGGGFAALSLKRETDR